MFCFDAGKQVEVTVLNLIGRNRGCRILIGYSWAHSMTSGCIGAKFKNTFFFLKVYFPAKGTGLVTNGGVCHSITHLSGAKMTFHIFFVVY
jgi:hypothetical protein